MTLWEGKSMKEAPISDEDFNKCIISYKKQDEKAGRELCDLSVQEVRSLLSPINCLKCNEPITLYNWTLDRVDNSKGHSHKNLNLCCRICNVAKKSKENRLISFDIQTYEKGETVEHHMV